MSEPFLSEIRIFSFNYAPKSWAMCNGQLLPINQNQALFSLLGTTYGGNGQTNFALPDLRGSVPIHMGQGNTLGEKAGEPIHTLAISEMPQHLHGLFGSSQAVNQILPPGNAGGQSANAVAAPRIGERWAVIVGVSDYKSTAIPHLRYAAADAQAFYDFVRSPAAGPSGCGTAPRWSGTPSPSRTSTPTA